MSSTQIPETHTYLGENSAILPDLLIAVMIVRRKSNNIDNDSLPVDKVALEQNEGDYDDSHDVSE